MTILKHEKEYMIRTYECDRTGNLRIVTLFNIFQDMADEHAERLNLGMTWCKNNSTAWIGSNYHIKIERLPRIHEKLRIITWPSEEKRISAVRDFEVYDENNQKIISASSVWVLIDIIKKRPLSLKATLPDYNIVQEKAVDTNFLRLPKIERIDTSSEFSILEDYIDINNHMNNAIYPLLAIESIDKKTKEKNNIKELEIEFKKEAFFDEIIRINVEEKDLVSLCEIIALNDNRELAKVRMSWG